MEQIRDCSIQESSEPITLSIQILMDEIKVVLSEQNYLHYRDLSKLKAFSSIRILTPMFEKVHILVRKAKSSFMES